MYTVSCASCIYLLKPFINKFQIAEHDSKAKATVKDCFVYQSYCLPKCRCLRFRDNWGPLHMSPVDRADSITGTNFSDWISRISRDLGLKTRDRGNRSSHPILPYEHSETLPKDLVAYRDLGNRASPVNRDHMKRSWVAGFLEFTILEFTIAHVNEPHNWDILDLKKSGKVRLPHWKHVR